MKRSRMKKRRVPVGASPGTLIADPAAGRSKLRLTLISPERCKTIDKAGLADIAANREKWSLLWLDCTGLGSVDVIQEVGRLFNLHPLALEDVVNAGQRPKVDFFDDHAFVVLSMIDDVAAHRYEQVSLFFGKKFIVTFQERAGDPFDPVRKRLEGPHPTGCARAARTISPTR